MQLTDPAIRKHLKTVAIWAALLLAYVVIGIDDWSRDLVQYETTMTFEPSEPKVQRLLGAPTGQPGYVTAADWVVAVRWAGKRIKNLQFKGEASDGEVTVLSFVRKHRVLRLTDDVLVRIDASGRTPSIETTSTARLHVGDLGRNTKTIRRLYAELEDIAEESNLNRVIVTGL